MSTDAGSAGDCETGGGNAFPAVFGRRARRFPAAFSEHDERQLLTESTDLASLLRSTNKHATVTPESKRTRAALLREDAKTRCSTTAATLRQVADELDELADAQEAKGRVAGPDGTEPANHQLPQGSGTSHEA